jgi:hypothetical protein
LEKDLLDEQSILKVVPAEYYAQVSQETLAFFCHKYGFYTLPTTELIEWLKPHVVPGKTIEIGAGVGTIGRALGIPLTDSCYMRTNAEVIAYYTLMGQPLTKYPEDIEELDAVAAVDKYKPEIVVGSWITHKYTVERAELGGNMFGVDEEYVLRNVKKYIMIGNDQVHRLKPLLALPHEKFCPDWLYSRSMSGRPNIIFIWENK